MGLPGIDDLYRFFERLGLHEDSKEDKELYATMKVGHTPSSMVLLS